MNTNFLFILWNQTPEIWPDGPLPLRWYGLFFAAAFFFGQMLITKIFKDEGKSEKDVDSLTYYMIIATVIGARLGHCLFYQPDFYLANPIEILKIWEGGLASHGATVGILVAMWLYSRKRPDQSWLWILDRIVIVVALGGAFIRMGNLMNSEIIGKPADMPWSMVFAQPLESTILKMEGDRIKEMHFEKGADAMIENGVSYYPVEANFTFQRDMMEGSSIEAFAMSSIPNAVEVSNGDEPHFKVFPEKLNLVQGFDKQGLKTLKVTLFGIPRHPAMVYESLSTFLLFIILFFLWNKQKAELPEGRLFSLFVVILFTLRFLYEFLKENQVAFESELALNMGQILSIPLVIGGLWLFFKTLNKKPTSHSSGD